MDPANTPVPNSDPEQDAGYFRSLVEQSRDAILVSQDDRIRYCNPSAVALLGAVSPDKLLGRTVDSIVHPEDREPAAERRRRILSLWERTTPRRFRLLRLDGMVVEVESSAAPCSYRARPAIQSILRDLTERLQAEAELTRVRGSLEEAQHLANLGNWELDLLAGRGWWSAEMYVLFGRDPDLGPPTPEEFEEWIHPDDRSSVLATVESISRTGQRGRGEFRTHPERGPIRHYRSIGEVVHRGGRAILVGTTQDITDQKLAEQALRESEARYRAIFDNAVEGFFQSTPDGRFLRLNQSLARIYGCESPEEAMDHYCDIANQLYVDPSRRQEFVREVEEHGAVSGFEFEIRRRDGSHAWISESARAVCDAGGSVLYYEGTVEDITERRRAEMALRESQALYQALVDNLPVHLFCKDLEGRFTFANRHFSTLIRRPLNELLGRTDFDLCPAEQAEAYRREDRRVIETRQPVQQERLVTDADGIERFIQVIKVPILDAHGEVSGIQAVFWDITERKRAEEALRENEAFLQMSQRVGKVGSWSWNLRTHRVRWSENMYELYGLAPGDFDGTLEGAVRNTHPDDLEVVRTAIQRIIERGETGEVEFRVLRSDGRTAQLWGMGEIVRDESGAPVEVVGTVMDVTERRQAEAARRELEARLMHAQKLESLGVLAGGIAHDFNNLLTSVLGNAGLAARRIPPESPAHPLLEEIERAARRAAELTQQMLAYSGRGAFITQAFRLDHVVDEMTSLLTSVVSRKAELDLHLHPATIEGDAVQIRQIVMNLITNASDALGGECGRIGIRTGIRRVGPGEIRSPFLPEEPAPGDYAFVSVEDTGCGMTPETLVRIFDPFFTTKFTGRGLGLAAVLGIVKGHGGTILVETHPGRGTRFEVLLPACASPAEQIGREPEGALPAHRGTVLVAEDEHVVRTFIRETLVDAGYRVIEATDGREALEVYARRGGEVSLVLLDLTMPRMDGVEVLNELRRLETDVPVLMMSGYSESEVLGRSLRENANGFLQKPFSPAELLSRVCRTSGEKNPARP